MPLEEFVVQFKTIKEEPPAHFKKRFCLFLTLMASCNIKQVSFSFSGSK